MYWKMGKKFKSNAIRWCIEYRIYGFCHCIKHKCLHQGCSLHMDICIMIIYQSYAEFSTQDMHTQLIIDVPIVFVLKVYNIFNITILSIISCVSTQTLWYTWAPLDISNKNFSSKIYVKCVGGLCKNRRHALVRPTA